VALRDSVRPDTLRRASLRAVSQDRMKSYIPGGFGSGRGIAIIALLVITGWMVTGFYTVQPDEVGIPLIFGKAYDQKSCRAFTGTCRLPSAMSRSPR